VRRTFCSVAQQTLTGLHSFESQTEAHLQKVIAKKMANTTPLASFLHEAGSTPMVTKHHDTFKDCGVSPCDLPLSGEEYNQIGFKNIKEQRAIARVAKEWKKRKEQQTNNNENQCNNSINTSASFTPAPVNRNLPSSQRPPLVTKTTDEEASKHNKRKLTDRDSLALLTSFHLPASTAYQAPPSFPDHTRRLFFPTVSTVANNGEGIRHQPYPSIAATANGGHVAGCLPVDSSVLARATTSSTNTGVENRAFFHDRLRPFGQEVGQDGTGFGFLDSQLATFSPGAPNPPTTLVSQENPQDTDKIDWNELHNILQKELDQNRALTTLHKMKWYRDFYKKHVDPLPFIATRREVIMAKFVNYLRTEYQEGRYTSSSSRTYLRGMSGLFKYLGWKLSSQGELCRKTALNIMAREETKDQKAGRLSAHVPVTTKDVLHITNSLLKHNASANSGMYFFAYRNQPSQLCQIKA
jgi:hypothetical protein